MNTFMDALKKTGQGIGHGVGSLTAGIGAGVQGVGNALTQGPNASSQPEGEPASQSVNDMTKFTTRTTDPNTPNDNSGPSSGIVSQGSDTNHPKDGGSGGGGGLLGTITSGVTSGANAILAPTADAAKSGAALVRDATGAGLSIGQKIAQSGLDMGADVATGTVSLAGTALGGVVATAAETSGTVFQPIGSGLKAIEGLDKLGQGVEAINGLSLGAVRELSKLTTKALNMSGKTPTFFDPDADGVVGVPDTLRGLVLLGLDEKNAKYAAYALHTVFSYPTSEKWLPAFDTTLPIHVAKMGRTRWGNNWGNFERLDWVDDVEIDNFFVPQKDEKQWSDYWKQGRQGFGVLLLIFEWGTTWPFYMPPIPVQEIPFSDDIGKVVRKAILPTILSNFKKARQADPDANNKHPSKMPSEKPPADAKDA